jgi:ACS family hexuronate transporter-like MFS transporter
MSTAAALQMTKREPGPEARPKRRFTVRGLRWWIAGLLTCITIINYLDRTALAVVGPTLKKELSIDEETFSYIVIAFQTVYGLMMPVAGRVIDWLNIRIGYALAIVWWSVAQMLTGFAGGWRSLAVLRGALGAGEAGNFPGAIKTVSQWFPPSERTVATGIVNMGSGVGALVAPPLVVFLILHSGWRAAFVLTGGLGLVWVVLWLLFYRAPEQHPLLSEAELLHIRQEGEPCPTVDRADAGVVRLVVRERNFWALAAARFLSEPAWQLFTYWIPFYLVSARHLELKQVAWFGWMPFLAGDIGCLAGGLLSPLFLRMGAQVLTARKLAVTVPALLMTLTAFTGSAATAGMAVLFFSIGAFAHQAISSTLLTLPADLFPKRAVATANGLSGTLGYLGGIVFTFIVGRAAATIGYTPLFWGIAVFDVAGAIVLWSFLRGGKPSPSEVVS